MNATRHEHPFTHFVVEDFAPAGLVDGLSWVPGPEWAGWEARYDNDCERGKRTTRRLDAIGPGWGDLFGWLNGELLATTLGRTCGVYPLSPDPTAHGAGLHVTEPGGHLSPHLDYALHPLLEGMERRLNLVLFLNREWREEWGGALELYDNAAATVGARIYPKLNRAVLWCPGDVEFHGTQRVEYVDDERAANVPPRVTAAAYYLAPARPGVTRRRALFVPQRVTSPGRGQTTS